MYYFGLDTDTRRIIESAHRERARVFAAFFANLFGRKTKARSLQGRRSEA